MSKRVLITGAKGFIGGHVCKYIANNTDWEFLMLDKKDGTDLAWSELSGLAKVDYIIHLAAEKHVSNSFKDMAPYIEANVKGTTRLLEALKDTRFEKMINFSTAAVLGPARVRWTGQWMIDYPWEESQYKPANPYAGSKAAQEIICNTYAEVYDMPIVNVRIDTPFGENQPAENFIPTVIRSMTEDKPISLYGRSKPGEFIYSSRHWIYCQDIAEDLVNILKGTYESASGQRTYHLVGNYYNVAEMANMISLCVGKNKYTINRVELPEKSNTYDTGLAYGLSSMYKAQEQRLDSQEFSSRLYDTVKSYLV